MVHIFQDHSTDISEQVQRRAITITVVMKKLSAKEQFSQMEAVVAECRSCFQSRISQHLPRIGVAQSAGVDQSGLINAISLFIEGTSRENKKYSLSTVPPS